MKYCLQRYNYRYRSHCYFNLTVEFPTNVVKTTITFEITFYSDLNIYSILFVLFSYNWRSSNQVDIIKVSPTVFYSELLNRTALKWKNQQSKHLTRDVGLFSVELSGISYKIKIIENNWRQRREGNVWKDRSLRMEGRKCKRGLMQHQHPTRCTAPRICLYPSIESPPSF